MAKLLRKVANRFRGVKPHVNGSWYPESWQSTNPSAASDGTQSLCIIDKDIDTTGHVLDNKESKFKAWTNRFRKSTRRKDLYAEAVGDSIELMSRTKTPTTISDSTEPFSPLSIPATEDAVLLHNPSLSESTAEIDPEFGFSIRRMRGDFGLYHDKNTPPRLYLDMSRQSNTFSPFRPFSPNILLPALDTSDSTIGRSRQSSRQFSTGSVDRYRSISASLAAGLASTRTSAAATTASRNVSMTSIAQPRFYSQANLTALGLNRAPTADSPLSSTSWTMRSPSGTQSIYSIRSFSPRSNTMRSLSAELSSLTSRKNAKSSIKSPIESRNASPSYSLTSPISFC